MKKLQISPTGDYFVHDGQPFFYQADTVWSAFTNASLEEWAYYLDYRRSQSFNALQMNVLAQWDRSESDIDIHPFKLDDTGTYDFSEINHPYFDRAERMLAMAADRGFVPALVLLWSNYVPGTFFDDLAYRNVMPKELIPGYVEYVATRFAKFNPIYFISGDTNFEQDSAAEHYHVALETVKGVAPEALTTLHLCGGDIDGPAPEPPEIPSLLMESPHLDFYLYQSSHFRDHGPRAYTYAESFYRQPIKRPILNGEPCYEGWEFRGRRHGPAEVREATWFSLLSGANAGIAYGANGIWQWHKTGKAFPPAVDDGRPKLYRSLEPFEWRTALRFEGASECSFAQKVFKTHDLFGIEPQQRHVLNPTSGIRLSATDHLSKVAIYSSCAIPIRLDVDVSRHHWTMVVLRDKHVAQPEIVPDGGGSVIKMPQVNSDVLFLGEASPGGDCPPVGRNPMESLIIGGTGNISTSISHRLPEQGHDVGGSP